MPQTSTEASSSAIQRSSDSTATQAQTPTQVAQVASTSSTDVSPGTSQVIKTNNTSLDADSTKSENEISAQEKCLHFFILISVNVGNVS